MLEAIKNGTLLFEIEFRSYPTPNYIINPFVVFRIHRDITGLPPIASLRKLGMGAGEIWFGVG